MTSNLRIDLKIRDIEDFWIISLIRLLKYIFNRFKSIRDSTVEIFTSTMWKFISFNKVFDATVLKIEMLSISNFKFNSTVCAFNLTSLMLIRVKVLNCSMLSVDKSAVSQFINMLLNSWSSYLESMIEIKLKNSLMKTIMMMQFFEIKRCLKAWFESKLIVVWNSMFCNSSNEIKNSSFDSNSIKNALMIFVDEIERVIAETIADAEMMFIENSSKYWIISSWSSFSSVLSYSSMYWVIRLLFLNCEKRSEKRFFEFFRFLSEWLIDQQSNLSHTKHFLDRRLDWNLSFDLSRLSRRLYSFRRYCLSVK
jgi:hypothetical protein